MSESFLERLSRFTPDPGNLNRDALLFTAGRGSARPNRGWQTAVALLAGTQALTLVLLYSPARPSVGGPRDSIVIASPPAAQVEIAKSDVLANPGVWSARGRLDVADVEERPDETVTLMDSGPPLRAFGSAPDAILN
jgi:hypothetical protein